MDKSGRALTFDAHCFSIGAVQAEEPPECDGKSATIYVLDGVIVGDRDLLAVLVIAVPPGKRVD